MVKSKKMRYNPYWYQGLDFVEEDPKFSNVDADIDMNGHAIINLKTPPTNDYDAVSKKYVDDAIAAGGAGPGGGPLQASQIHSVATAQIQALNVQEAINEISSEGAFLDSPNVFSEVNTFNQVPKLAAGVSVPSNEPQALTTVAKVTSLIAAIKAAGINVDQTNPLINLTGANVQEVINQSDEIFSQLKSNLHLVGTYDVDQDKVLEAFGSAGNGNIIINKPLPASSANNKNMYLLVKVGGIGTGNALAVQFSPGDIIYSNGNSWKRIFTSIQRSAATSAAQVSSVATQQIKSTNVQAVIDEISNRVAFKDLDNVFAKVVKLAPGVVPTGQQDLATISKVKSVVTDAIADIKASTVGVDPATPPLNNLTGATVQDVIEQADDLFDELADLIVSNTSLVGLYNAANNTVTRRFIGDIDGQPAGGISEGQALPAGDDTNKNMYLYVHEEGTGTGEAPAELLKVGDLIISNGVRWDKISLSRVTSASNVSITAIPGVTGNNVQTALEFLANKPAGSSTAATTTFTPAGSITATNVQAAIQELDKNKANAADVVKLTDDQTVDGNKTFVQPIKYPTEQLKPVDDKELVTKAYVDARGASYVSKRDGQLATALDANQNQIHNLAIPTANGDAVNLGYLSSNYVTKTGGQLTGNLDANTKKITNLAAPTANGDAVNMLYVTNTVANYVTKTGGVLTGDLDAGSHKIVKLAAGTVDEDAINKGQLDAAIASIKSQLVGKLTFAGSYNATTNKIANVNQAISAQFPQYVAGQALPADTPDLLNHFFIVTEKGTGVAPAPTVPLNIGDLIYSSGSGWQTIPLGITTAAVNVSIDPIASLPGVNDVQVALDRLANKPIPPSTADTITFAPSGSVTANNVQAAIQELDTKKANVTAVVNLTDDQRIQGTKTFEQLSSDMNMTLKANPVGNAFAFSLIRDPDKSKRSYVAFEDADALRLGSRLEFKAREEQLPNGQTLNRIDVAAYGIPSGNTNQNKLFLGSKIILNVQNQVIEGVGTPRSGNNAANKQYVDDAVKSIKVPSGIVIEKVQNVDVTAAIASLAGKGTMAFSYNLTRDPDTKDVLSALFGMKITLTAPWNPGDSTTPVELPGCQIAGDQYFKGLPIPVDTTLQGGSFKTVGQIGLIRVVPTGGVNMPQADSPLMIGRIVCAIDAGNTKLYAVFKHNADIAVPTGTGAFFTVRYEGLPTMVI